MRFVKAELPLSATRSLHDDPVGFDPAWLQKAGDLGWFAMLVGEQDGGGSVSGQGLIDAAIVAEELGRHGQPGPFIPMNIVASAISKLGSEEQRSQYLPGIVSGATVATWAWADRGGEWDSGASMAAVADGDKICLDGQRGFVLDACSAHVILVAAQMARKPVQLLVPTDSHGVTVTPLHALDLSRRLATVSFDSTSVPRTCLLGSGDLDLVAQLQIGVALVLADTVGAVDALFEMTWAYAKDRIAFGRPIGSYQAIKHILADVALDLETCKAGAVAAAEAAQAKDDNADEVVSAIASGVFDRANEIAQQCLQIHGGIGYTWEHNLHLLLRRVRSNSALLGNASWHRERLCRFQGMGVSA